MSDLPMGSTSNVIISIEGQGRNTERVDTVFCRGNALELLSVRRLRGRLLQARKLRATLAMPSFCRIASPQYKRSRTTCVHRSPI